jgi:hypothetical protein
MVPVVISLPDYVRAYGLASPVISAVYLHHITDHNTALRGLQIRVELPHLLGLRYEWVDPATGLLLSEGPVRSHPEALSAPPFAIDVVLVITQKS